jgi:hypothetical protein
MPRYLLLLYASDVDAADRAARWAEMPEWEKVTNSLAEAGLLVENAALHMPELATTVRVRDGETTLTDGPFTVTKEILGGFYLLDCADLDEAVAAAARLPMARYGSIEVRPVIAVEDIPR